jgi:hypothetical protein
MHASATDASPASSQFTFKRGKEPFIAVAAVQALFLRAFQHGLCKHSAASATDVDAAAHPLSAASDVNTHKYIDIVLQVKAAAAQAQAQAAGAVNMSAAAVKQVVDTALGTWSTYDK